MQNDLPMLVSNCLLSGVCIYFLNWVLPVHFIITLNIISHNKLTDFAVINIFHGINVPSPCSKNVKNTNLYLSYGGLISIFARSIVIPVERNEIQYTLFTIKDSKLWITYRHIHISFINNMHTVSDFDISPLPVNTLHDAYVIKKNLTIRHYTTAGEHL